ncbi:MAG: hypothetical protein BWY89_01731 [Bacteroidetes bacterium ADurb.BinA012]|nr:MAG: hypothetical protein BWY89_01731 [Bacteroidetes bacterium ADurb.BinA012]
MFSVAATFLRFEAPIPPIPIAAMFNLSLGARWPSPLTTLPGRIVSPANAAPVVPTNDRLVIFFVSSFISFQVKFFNGWIKIEIFSQVYYFFHIF